MWPFARRPVEENQHVCPLCDRSAPRRKAVRLYGHLVCRGCQREFANRRAGAWLVDRLLFVSAAFTAWEVLGAADPAAGRAAFAVIYLVAFALRDTVRGCSPGRAAFGLRVVSDASGEPADPFAALARNAVLLVPFLPIVAATQLAGGKRIGDGLMRTRVVWTRHARSRVFR